MSAFNKQGAIYFGSQPIQSVHDVGIDPAVTAVFADPRFAPDGSPRRLRKRLSQISHFFVQRGSRREYEERLLAASKALPFMNISGLRYKYLRDYMGLYLGYDWRREAIASHYEIVAAAVNDKTHPDLFSEPVELWTATYEDNGSDKVSVILGRDIYAPLEGELQLSFVANGKVLASLTFLFVYGDLLGYPNSLACVIGSLQGRPDTRSEVRRISKLNHEISPFALLLTSLRSVCDVLSISKIVGVSAGQQVAVRGEIAKHGQDYDALWTSVGGTIQPNGFFLLSADALQSQASSSAHRRRAARKAERKEAIADAVSLQFRFFLMKEHVAGRGAAAVSGTQMSHPFADIYQAPVANARSWPVKAWWPRFSEFGKRA